MHVVLWVQDWGWSRHKRSWIIHWICLCWAMKWNSNTAWNKVKLLRHKACYKQEKNSVLGLSLWDVSNPWVWGQDGYQWLKERSYICIKRSQTLPHRKSGVTLTLKHTHTPHIQKCTSREKTYSQSRDFPKHCLSVTHKSPQHLTPLPKTEAWLRKVPSIFLLVSLVQIHFHLSTSASWCFIRAVSNRNLECGQCGFHGCLKGFL